MNIAGPILGTPKVIAALTSGDTSDSIWLPAFAFLFSEHGLLSKTGRAKWFRTMSSGGAMLPQGGEAVWGDLRSSPDDSASKRDTDDSFGTLVCIGGEGRRKYERYRRRERKSKGTSRGCVPLSVEESADLMYNVSGEATRHLFESSTKWGQPLTDPLPRAPSLKMYCLYGVGVPTERAYNMREEGSELKIDTIFTSDGDGTVPLVSLGYMCVNGWEKGTRLNPGGIEVTTREYMHEPATLSLRGGPKAADHVNVLGNGTCESFHLRPADRTATGWIRTWVYKSTLILIFFSFLFLFLFFLSFSFLFSFSFTPY